MALGIPVGGKQNSLALGDYPSVSLREARTARDGAKEQLARGVNPAAQRKIQKLLSANKLANTFEAVAKEWFTNNQSRWVPSYSVRLRSRLDDDLLPALGKRPIDEILPLEVLEAIRRIERRDAIEMVKRVMQMAGAIFRFGVATGRCAKDPTADLRGALKPPGPVKHRAGLPEKDLPEFLAKLMRYDGDATTKIALKLVLLAFVRTAELRFARWDEFEGLDGASSVWRIPAERMKRRRMHLVPLVSIAPSPPGQSIPAAAAAGLFPNLQRLIPIQPP